MREYLYTNYQYLDMLMEQNLGHPLKQHKWVWKFALSLTGPSVEVTEETSERVANRHEKIVQLLEHLTKSKRLGKQRPKEMTAQGHRFVLETMVAKKIIIPPRPLEVCPGIREFALWVSDPDPRDFAEEEYVFHGSFLYLTEIHFDDEKRQTVFTGCSALQAVANNLDGRPFLMRDAKEPLGRRDCSHPILKLQRAFGATSGDSRHIQALYRIRYITNEQCYTYCGKERRVNDILGYPVFIASTM